jgi:hypothetical protein
MVNQKTTKAGTRGMKPVSKHGLPDLEPEADPKGGIIVIDGGKSIIDDGKMPIAQLNSSPARKV